GRVDQEGHDVDAFFTGPPQRIERLLDSFAVAFGAQLFQPGDLPRIALRVQFQQRDVQRFVAGVRIDAHDFALALVDLALVAVAGLGNFALEQTGLNRRDYPAEIVDSLEIGIDRRFGLVGQGFVEIAAAERVNRAGDAAFFGDDL